MTAAIFWNIITMVLYQNLRGLLPIIWGAVRRRIEETCGKEREAVSLAWMISGGGVRCNRFAPPGRAPGIIARAVARQNIAKPPDTPWMGESQWRIQRFAGPPAGWASAAREPVPPNPTHAVRQREGLRVEQPYPIGCYRIRCSMQWKGNGS